MFLVMVVLMRSMLKFVVELVIIGISEFCSMCIGIMCLCESFLLYVVCI